jgi:hypothetical protein
MKSEVFGIETPSLSLRLRFQQMPKCSAFVLVLFGVCSASIRLFGICSDFVRYLFPTRYWHPATD